MAFINEEIPDFIKENFKFPVHIGPGGRKSTLWKWTIDKDRNAFLVLTKKYGGAHDGTVEVGNYVFSWNDFLVKFSANPFYGINPEGKRTIKWFIYDISIPEGVIGKKEVIEGLIAEAFEAKGWLYSLDGVASVEVEFASGSAA